MAEQLLNGRAPVNVIFAAGTDTLALLIEVLDLIPVPQRWGITFSTYFTRLQAGTECQLRFFLDGTAEATSLRNDARAVKVDLTGALGEAAGGALVEQARAGVLEFRRTAPPKVQPAKRRPAVSDDELEGLLAAEGNSDSQQDAETYRLQKPISRLGSPPPVSRIESAFRRKQSGKGSWVIAVLALALFGGLGTGAFFVVPPILQNFKQQREIAQTEVDSDAEVPPEIQSKNETAAEQPELPFEGRSPFELLDENDAISPRQILLSELEKTEDHTLFHLLTDDISRIAFELPDQDGQLSLFRSEMPEATWVLSHKAHTPLASIRLKHSAAGEGVEVIWSWKDDVVEVSELLAAAYSLQQQSITVLAASNSDATIDEQRNVKLKIPQLFGDASPFANLPTSKDGQPFEWNVETPEDSALAIKTYSLNSLTFKRASAEQSELRILSTEEADKHEVVCGTTKIGQFAITKAKQLGLEMRWQWAEQPQGKSDFLKGTFLLFKSSFELLVNREDTVSDKINFKLMFPAPPIFDESGLKSGDAYLIPLPNPTSVETLPENESPLLQRWNNEKVQLALHPGFQSLIKTPGRTLSLDRSDEKEEWTVRIVDRQPEDGADLERPIKLGTYWVEKPLPGMPYEHLRFRWSQEASQREIGAAELVRWCPLIVTAGRETRVFLQRLPDRWLIPPWDRQSGFTLEQYNSVDDNRSGYEFSDIVLKSGPSARFKLTYSIPGKKSETRKSFEAALDVDQNGEITHVLSFPLGRMEDLTDEELDGKSEIGILRTVITLPAERSNSPKFEMATTAYVRVDVPLFKDPKIMIPAELMSPVSKASNGTPGAASKKHSEDIESRWRDGDISPLATLGTLPLLQTKRELKEQKQKLLSTVRRFENEVNKRLVLFQKDKALLVDAQNKTSEQGAINDLQTRIQAIDQEMAELANRLVKAKELQTRFGQESNSPYDDASNRCEMLAEKLKDISMSLSLSMELGGDHSVAIRFIDAQMEGPDDRR